jgi:uncharacterized protein (TIGR02646 family)
MIQIDRSKTSAPRALLEDGPKHLVSVIEPRAKIGALRSTDFDRSTYGSPEVRERLWKMQHGKCCFCERSYEAKHSTVEHFRPKTEATDDKGTKRTGYWWLGYELKNLYFCCPGCNTPKKSYFPLEPGATPLPARSLPWKTKEQTLLLDPGFEDPEPHIEWVWSGRKHGYVPAGKTERGRQTIHATALDQRDHLKELRGRYYKKHIAPLIKRHREAKARDDAAAQAKARDEALGLAAPDAEFAGMARYVLRRSGIL